MNAPVPVNAEISASNRQREASDPHCSVWVAANAGSGKTHVLVERVIRMMLGGTEPSRILCLTFTKAAASEMANRLYERLGKWIAFDDDALFKEIVKLGEQPPDAERLARARRLFTLALEIPGGLKIQTIHAFCERLLQLFPIEAGVVPGFEVMDERLAAEMLEQARQHVLMQAERDPASPEGRALATVIARVQADALDRLLRDLLKQRADIGPVLETGDGVALALQSLTSDLGLTARDSLDGINAEIAAVDAALYGRLIAALASGPATNIKTAEALKNALACSDINERVALLRARFMTGKHEPCSAKTLMAPKFQTANPDLASALLAEQTRIVALLGKVSAATMLTATEALLVLAAAIAKAFERAKRYAGRYDYEDLIARARRLLTEQVSAQWVLYKLDGGIDHVLVDEAQDTNTAQWQIVSALTAEFFSGAGVRPGLVRTVFAVGDRKQSIFSFQGADPASFDAAKAEFQSKSLAAGQCFAAVPFTVSFRSTPDILQAVDDVFASPAAFKGLRAEGDDPVIHATTREGHAGCIEIWPVEFKDESPEPEPWTAPVDREPGNHPRRKLARRIAATIKSWLDDKRMLASRGRPVRPGDILVLVRRRNSFTDALIRELRQRGIPVAGADRLRLGEHIAVEDLLAAARFALQPHDDFNLACVLKGPLLARDDGKPIDDNDLFALAYDRGATSLYERLCNAVETGAPYRQACAILAQWQAIGCGLPPFDFFSQLLTAGRQSILARLGPEANDPMAALLDLALDYEFEATPSLPGFLQWFAAGESEIKRNMEQGADEVRVMTVHGAKGLEANIVFLPDTCDVIDGKQQSPLVRNDANLPLWRLSGLPKVDGVERWYDRQLEKAHDEYRRLLYVAMTRARDELYIGGYCTGEKYKEGCWYELIGNALQSKAAELRGPDDVVTGWRIEGRQTAEPDRRGESMIGEVLATMPPDWSRAAAPAETEAFRWLTPSHLVEGRSPALSPLDSNGELRFARGKAVHSLLQMLPELAADQRRAAACRYLANRGLGEALADEVLAVIDHPDHAAYFAPGSLAEVPVAALVGSDAIAGRIDRLAIAADCVRLVDFKTGKVPASPNPGYLKQLAAYRRAITPLFPGKPIRTALLWTEGPKLFEIPDGDLAGL